MPSPDQVPQGWGNIAPVYERAFEKLTKQFSDEALRLLALKPGEKVLDVATGTGAFSLAAARQGGNVLATDFAEGMIERLQQRINSEGLGNIQAQVMDGQNLELNDDSHHVAASIVGVIFFPDIAKGFAELNDPLDQRTRLEAQAKLREAGDEEAQRMDESFLEAMEYGMPPMAGFGLSERLFSVLLDLPIRETIFFRYIEIIA